MKNWLTNDKNITRDSYIWNMSGSMIHAFQQVVLLIIVTRVCGLIEAGILTIAYANGNLFLAIGKYGMRYFQVSDTEDQYTFGDYLLSRLITTILMIATAFIYVAIVGKNNHYTPEKSLTVIWLTLFKAVDSLEDVFHGLYQQKGRLDIAARCWTVRLGSSILLLAVCIVLKRNVLWAVIAATIYAAVSLLFTLACTWPEFQANLQMKIFDSFRLLWSCFPLFLGAFLSLYIGNAPKYAIDAQLTDDLQAYYGFIAMPVFVIGLLNGFIFNPMIHGLSMLWNNRNYSKFIRRIIRQAGIILLITLFSMGVAYILGIPILSILYNTDLSAYKTELLILLAGGGCLSLSGLMNTALTIIRYQWTLGIGYVLVSLLALIFSDRIVSKNGIFGASVLYLSLMVMLCVCFGIFLVIGIKRTKKNNLKS